MAQPRTPALHAPLPHSEGTARVRRLAQGQSAAVSWIGDGLELGRKTSRIQVKKARGVRPTPLERSVAAETSAGLGAGAPITDAPSLIAHNDLVDAFNDLRGDYLQLKAAYDSLARGMIAAKTGER